MSIAHNNEARSTSFLFTIGQEKNLTYAVQSSNIADLTLSTTPFPTRNKAVKLPSNKIEQTPLIVDIIISADYNEWITLYKWMMLCKNNVESPQKYMEPCKLTPLTAQNEEVASFLYSDTFPTEISGVQYAFNNTEAPVITCTVTFEYNIFKILLPNGETIDEQYTG